MSSNQSDELFALLKEATNISHYLERQIKSKIINGAIDKQNIQRFINALEQYIKTTEIK